MLAKLDLNFCLLCSSSKNLEGNICVSGNKNSAATLSIGLSALSSLLVALLLSRQ